MIARSAEPVLSVEHVVVHFGGLIAIADMNFQVYAGRGARAYWAERCGQTTAFNVITGFLRPTTGQCCTRACR